MCARTVVTDGGELWFGAYPATFLVLAVVLLSSCAARYDRFNSTVSVDVRHPPTVGFLVEEVVFVRPDPSAAPPDRSLLAQLEGLVTWSEWLDPGACRAEVIGINVCRCVAGQDREETSRESVEELRGNARRRDVTEYHARTQADITALFEVIDLAGTM